MSFKKRLLLSAIPALIIIFLTGLGFNHICEPCFWLHIIPWGIGYTGGSNGTITLYYIALWAILTIIIAGISELITSKDIN